MKPTNDNGAHSFTEGATFETAENINEFLKEDKTMKAIYLQSMTDFVLKVVQTPNINEAICWEQTEGRLNKIYQYSLFLKQPLQLGFFVPCDENGNFLDPSDAFKSCEKGFLYGKAKERVLFKGFEHYLFREANNVKHNKSRKCFSFPNYNGVIIEDLISLEVELASTAIKQIAPMKPQFKLEQIYLDLSKLSEKEMKKAIGKLPIPTDCFDYELYNNYKYLQFLSESKFNKEKWFVDKSPWDKTEINYSQFLDMMGESEEALQVENTGWIEVNDTLPLCVSTGDWDGKQSEIILAETITGKKFLAQCYEGFMDGSAFYDWYQVDEINSNDWLINESVSRWMKIPFYSNQ